MVEDIKKAYNYLKEQDIFFESDTVRFIIRDPDDLIREIIQARIQ